MQITENIDLNSIELVMDGKDSQRVSSGSISIRTIVQQKMKKLSARSSSEISVVEAISIIS
jgi:hypothetical protein